MTTLIRNGTVVTAVEKMEADVLIEGSKVVALLGRGTPLSRGTRSTRQESWSSPAGSTSTLTWSCLLAAHSPQTPSRPGQGLRPSAEPPPSSISLSRPKASRPWTAGKPGWARPEGNCAIDYGFHMITGDINDQTLKEMEQLVREGVTSFKMFMAYPGVFYSDDGDIVRAMQKAAEDERTICMHAENGIAIDVYVQQALDRGQTDPIHHGLVRKAILEGEAAHRAIKLAQVTGAQLYIVHLSAREALDEVIKARDEGRNVFAETCPDICSCRSTTLAMASMGPSTSAHRHCGTWQKVTRRDCGVGFDQRSADRLDRPLPFLYGGSSEIRDTETARAGRLLQDPEWDARRRESDGADLQRRGV